MAPSRSSAHGYILSGRNHPGSPEKRMSKVNGIDRKGNSKWTSSTGGNSNTKGCSATLGRNELNPSSSNGVSNRTSQPQDKIRESQHIMKGLQYPRKSERHDMQAVKSVKQQRIGNPCNDGMPSQYEASIRNVI